MATLASELDALDEHGFVVLPALLSAREVDAIRAALAPHVATTPTGRNAFEGRHSQRVFALLAKSAVFADLVSHPRILRLLDHLLEPNYLLSSALAINNGPGEARQQIHFDDSFYRSLARPRQGGVGQDGVAVAPPDRPLEERPELRRPRLRRHPPEAQVQVRIGRARAAGDGELSVRVRDYPPNKSFSIIALILCSTSNVILSFLHIWNLRIGFLARAHSPSTGVSTPRLGKSQLCVPSG
ncbi:MAG: phytanoyl-CoA dioxygenase family protein [Candidatus Rokubacteria bacterium]|nr:phytanoyl-CoA dioxygenase family protein [Candidatus Rokubacteria bacterium]